VGSGPWSVAAADVNGDGKVDLISANSSNPGTLSVLFNAPTFTGGFTGNGSGLTSLNASQLSSGTVPLAQIPNLDAGKITIGILGTAQIPDLAASKITSGTLSDARLSANVALRSGGNTFTGNQTITSGSVGIGTASPGRALQVGDAAIFGSQGMIRLSSRTPTGANVTRTWDVGVPETGDDASGTGYSFVIKDTLQGSATNTTPEFMIKYVSGYVGLGTNVPGEKLHVIGNIRASGTITPNSDRNAKTEFEPVDTAAILKRVAALPIQRWRFKAEEPGVKHVGPMAQDFHAAFGLGAAPTAIATVDADGVALAAIQGLNQKVGEELKRRDNENAELKRELAELKKIVQQITHQRTEESRK
jgi:hypothetical protein